MAVTDFLFGDKPVPTSITGSTTSIQGMPDWYQDYTKGLIARANAIASEPYQPYTGSRIAGLNERDRQAGQMVQSNVGSYQPYLNQASSMYSAAAGMRGADAANPYLGQSAGMSAFGAGQPLINQAAGSSALSTAQPLIGQASGTWPSAMNEYMSPYTGAVVNEIGRLGTQNLMENILPGVNQTFTGSGMFGSSRHGDFTNRAIRDASKAIAGEQAKALEAGYGTSANIFGQDMSRLAGLSSTVGGLATSDFGRQLEAGRTLGGLTSDDANRLANIGNIAGTLTQGDARNAIDIANRQAALGQMRSQLGATDAGAISALGEQERGLTQKMLDTRYQDFTTERDDPWSDISRLSAIVRGQQVPTYSTSTTTGPAQMNPSLATNLLSTGIGLGGLSGYI